MLVQSLSCDCLLPQCVRPSNFPHNKICQKCGCWASCWQRVSDKFFSGVAGSALGVRLAGFRFGPFRGEKDVRECLIFPSPGAAFCAEKWPHIRGQKLAPDV